MAEYIVKSSDYSFDIFEHKGLGGVQKYIAVPADTSKTKLIVKHEMSYSACNEFVASHIAKTIGIKAPDTYLFEISKKDKSLFKTPYAVGIEYIERFSKLPPYDEIRGSQELKTDFINSFALYSLLGVHGDNLQCGFAQSRGIVSVDFEQYFNFSDDMSKFFLHDNTVIETLSNHILDYIQRNSLYSDVRISAKMAAEKLNLPLTDIYKQFLVVFKRFAELTDEELEPMYEALTMVYPDYTEIFYYGFLLIQKQKIVPIIDEILKLTNTLTK